MAEPPVSGHASPSHKGVILFSEEDEPAFIQREEKVEPWDKDNAEHCRMYSEHLKRKLKKYAEPNFNHQPMQPDMGSTDMNMPRQQAARPDMGGGMAGSMNAELLGQIPPQKTPMSQPQKDAEPSEIGAFSERRVQAIIAAAVAPFQTKITELSNTVAAQTRQLHAVNAGTLAEQNRLQRQEITQFCERLVKEGKIEPKELKPTEVPITLIDQLLMLPHDKKIVKFGERQLTQREAMMVTLESRPPIRTFGEKIGVDPSEVAGFGDARRKELLSKTVTGKRVLKREAEAAKLPANRN